MYARRGKNSGTFDNPAHRGFGRSSAIANIHGLGEDRRCAAEGRSAIRADRGCQANAKGVAAKGSRRKVVLSSVHRGVPISVVTDLLTKPAGEVEDASSSIATAIFLPLRSLDGARTERPALPEHGMEGEGGRRALHRKLRVLARLSAQTASAGHAKHLRSTRVKEPGVVRERTPAGRLSRFRGHGSLESAR